MNERIKAIGHQAGLAFIEDGVYGQRWYSSKCGLDVSEYQKLVELIVAECAELCSDLDGGENMFSRGIRRHFGIEP